MDKVKEKSQSIKKKIVIPIDYKMWSSLRKIAFDKEISMSQLTRWAIQNIINKFEKPVDVE